MSSRIVVIDPDLAILALMHDLLAPAGYRVACASTTAAGYCAIRQERPVLVIVEPRLETPDAGRRLIERLRAEADTADLPIIACSADHRRLHPQPAWLRARNCTTLAKPFTLEELLGRVAAALTAPVPPLGFTLDDIGSTAPFQADW
jgi:DNA-binding response OmpR family regulator